MSTRPGYGACDWTDVELVEEMDFIWSFQRDTLWPEFIQRYIARVGGYYRVPAHWKAAIR